MTTINYTIKFYSEWHCGSGLSAGSDLDALVVKDADGFPFVPGKTLKGLFREAALEILALQNDTSEVSGFITEMFGYFDDEKAEKSKILTKGKAFFSNAVINNSLRNDAKELKEFFYRDMASTAIGNNGIAKEHSLRRMETVIPCELVGSISGVEEKYQENLIKCLKYIKRLGQNRNRGLGRCSIEVVESKEEAKA